MSKGLSAVDLEDMHRLSGSKLPLEIYCYQQGRADELDKIDKMILLGCEELSCDECGYKMYSQDVCQQAYTIGIIENYITEQLKGNEE